MTDISIIGTGCLIVANAGALFWLCKYAKRNEDLRGRLTFAEKRGDMWLDVLEARTERIVAFEAAEAKRQAQRIAAAKKGRATQTARALAKKVAGHV